MTPRLMVAEHLIDANRALETLRDHATSAYVRAESLAKSIERNGDAEAQADAERLWTLALRIKAWRERLYSPEIDTEILDLVRESAARS